MNNYKIIIRQRLELSADFEITADTEVAAQTKAEAIMAELSAVHSYTIGWEHDSQEYEIYSIEKQ